MRSLIAIVLIILVCVGCSQKAEPPSKPAERPRTEKPKPHKALYVTLYGFVFVTGRTRIDFAQANMDSVSIGWGGFSRAINKSDISRLRSLVENSGLHDFRPEPSWFAGLKPTMPIDGGGELLIAWADGKTVFVLPPYDDVLKGVPVEAREYYRKLDGITRLIGNLENKYAKTGRRRYIAPGAWDSTHPDTGVRQWDKETDSIQSQILPPGGFFQGAQTRSNE